MRASLRPDGRLIALSLILALTAAGCSGAKKKTTPELSRLEGKRVALVEVQGEPTARRIIEVALVNQLIRRGTFFLVSQREVDAARSAHDSDSSDWRSVAQKAGADVALRAHVLQFDAETSEGYSKEEEDDPQMVEERGEEGHRTERLYKVRGLKGKVRIELRFLTLSDGDLRTADAEAENEVRVEARDSAAHLPPKLRFLERLTEEAFSRFFTRYN